jgi:hypothetical protein
VTAPDRGSATVEFVSLGILLMVPLAYLVIVLGRIQAATFAADGSAREAARAFVTAGTEDDGARRAEIAVRLGLRDQGFDEHDGSLALRCDRTACLTPGAHLVARVEIRVELPGVPGFIGHRLSTNVRVRSEQTAVVDEFRAPPGEP